VNEEIRMLFLRSRGWGLGPADAAVYERLLEEWAAATRAEADCDWWARAA
jgi:hypothetical protein